MAPSVDVCAGWTEHVYIFLAARSFCCAYAESGAIAYRYEFDTRRAGDLRLERGRYEILQDALRLLRDELEAWNRRALDHGAGSRPYENEVRDLDRMIEWGNEKLAHVDMGAIWVDGISVGSLRYAKAALLLAIRRREEERASKAQEGWPDAALSSLDEGIAPIRKLAERIECDPSDVLWQVVPKGSGAPLPQAPQTMEWDVFICHASEDKEDFARPLAEGLQARGLNVWFDEFTLTVGDSLRRSIDRGLAHSKFGVVVVSPNFLGKEWPQRELDGLVAREVAGVKVILPIWHQITAEEIRSYSPTLADRVATSSSKGVGRVIEDLLRAMRPNTQQPAQTTVATPARQPMADVRVMLIGPVGHERFIVENWGDGVARDVHFEIEPENGKASPLVSNDCEEKLPIEVLRSGARVELLTALAMGMGTTFRAKWWWRDENGAVQERREKVLLQRG